MTCLILNCIDQMPNDQEILEYLRRIEDQQREGHEKMNDSINKVALTCNTLAKAAISPSERDAFKSRLFLAILDAEEPHLTRIGSLIKTLRQRTQERIRAQEKEAAAGN